MDKLKLVKTVVFILTFLLVFGSLMLLGTLFKKTHSAPRLPEEISLGERRQHVAENPNRDNLLYIGISDGARRPHHHSDTASGRKISTIRVD